MKCISAHFKSWIAKKYRLLLTLCILMVAQWEIRPLKLHLAKHSIVPINLARQLPQHRPPQQRAMKNQVQLGGSQSGGNEGGIDLPLPIFTQSRCWDCLYPTLDFQGSVSGKLPSVQQNPPLNAAALVPTTAGYECPTPAHAGKRPFTFWPTYGTSATGYSAGWCPFTPSLALASALYVPKQILTSTGRDIIF